MFANEADLDDQLSEPTDRVVQAMRELGGDTMVLGAGGKMGYSLTRMLRRGLDLAGGNGRVIAVSRFSRPNHEASFHAHNIETIAGDLLQPEFLDSLPIVDNVIQMTGFKFGTDDRASTTWAVNVLLPAAVCQRFHSSRMMAFSTGNVYPLVPAKSGGSVETDPLGPVGEYAMTALGRERALEYFALRDRIPISIVRLNYAVEMRYGVLVDLAKQVLAGKPIDVSMGYANVIWQGDANAWALCALADAASPPFVVNVAGRELLEVRAVCEQYGQLLNRPVTFSGNAADNALLSDSSRARDRYGPPRYTSDQLIEAVSAWLTHGGSTWDRPTHFQTRDGRF